MEAGSSVTDCLRILCNLAAEDLVGITVVIRNRIEGTCSDAAPAPLADVRIDPCLSAFVADRVGSALLGTAPASTAQLLINMRLSGIMLLHFAGSGTAAHSDVLQSTAKACCLMPLEVRQRNKNICIHHRTANVSFLAIFTISHRNQNIIRTLQTVSDDNLTSGCNGIKAVDVRAVHMLRCASAASGIQSIAVRKEGNSLLLLHEIRNCLGILGTEVRNVAKLAEVHLDRYELSLHVNGADSCRAAKLLELFRKRCSDVCPEICKKYVCHNDLSPFFSFEALFLYCNMTAISPVHPVSS